MADDLSGSGLSLVRMVQSVFFFFIFYTFLKMQKFDLRVTAFAVLLFGFFISLTEAITFDHWSRSGALTFGEASFVSVYLFIPCLVILRVSTNNWVRLSAIILFMSSLFVAKSLTGLFLSIVLLGVWILLCCDFSWKIKVTWILFCSVVLGVFIILNPYLAERLVNAATLEDGSGNLRVISFLTIVTNFVDHSPIFGFGLSEPYRVYKDLKIFGVFVAEYGVANANVTMIGKILVCGGLSGLVGWMLGLRSIVQDGGAIVILPLVAFSFGFGGFYSLVISISLAFLRCALDESPARNRGNSL